MQAEATGGAPSAAAGTSPAAGPMPPSFGSRGGAMGWGRGLDYGRGLRPLLPRTAARAKTRRTRSRDLLRRGGLLMAV